MLLEGASSAFDPNGVFTLSTLTDSDAGLISSGRLVLPLPTLMTDSSHLDEDDEEEEEEEDDEEEQENSGDNHENDDSNLSTNLDGLDSLSDIQLIPPSL